MKSAKLPKPNITKKERQALIESRKEKSIMILPADNGKATFIMGTGEYEQKVKTMLSDNKTYEKLNKDPTPKYKRQLEPRMILESTYFKPFLKLSKCF